MTVPVIFTYDATSRNEHVLPSDVQAAGYDTQAGGGTGFIAWTPEQFAAHQLPYPAMHIDQDPNASDPTADWLDVEAGAATEAEITGWLGRARTCFAQKVRPDQRWPGIYLSESNLTSAVALVAGAGFVNVPFWVANYNFTEQQAIDAVTNAMGPYPRIGHQFTDQEFGGLADGSYFSLPYVQTMAGHPITEDSMFSGQTTAMPYVPFPSGSFKSIMLYKDFVTAASHPVVRVAVYSPTKGYQITSVTLSESVPQTVTFQATDAEAVSLSITSGTGPVGYTLS